MRAAALGLNEATQRVWKETALPPTPSSPSPTFSPPSSPKQRRQASRAARPHPRVPICPAAPSPATPIPTPRAHALPPAHRPPRPTQAELTAEAAAAKLAASLKGAEMQRRFNHSSLSAEGGRSCDSDSDASMAAAASEVQIAIAAWEASGGRESRESGGSSSRKRR